MTKRDHDESTSSEGGVESALTTLQPLRDLAKNWDIDIAACLEEYLHDLLRHLPEEEQERVVNHEKLNFAQAALVLQNSSNIYSRKVEYLYSLVYKALEEICAGRKDAASSRSRSKAVDPEIEEFFNFDPNQEFLLLDDVLPTDNTENCAHINLREDVDPARSSTTTRGSLGSIVSRTRLSLASETTGDRSVTMMNKEAHRALIGSLDTGSLRLIDGHCDIDPSGVLLMPGTSTQTQPDRGSFVEMATTTSFTNHDDDGGFIGVYGDDDDDDGDHGGGFAMADDSEIAPCDEQNIAPEPEQRKRVTFADSVYKEKKADPWELMDPHTPDTSKARPLRVGKTIKLPLGVEEPPSERVTGARTRRTTRTKRDIVLTEKATASTSRSLVTETFKATLAARKRSHNETTDAESSFVDENSSHLPTVPLRGLVFGEEFAYIAKATAKRRAAERRELRKRQSQANTARAAIDDNDDDSGGFAFGGDDDDDDYDSGNGGGFFEDDNEDPMESNTGMASLDEVYENQSDASDTNADRRTFEQLCRAHIEAFARGAEKYAVETQLSKRVGQWQERIAPLLEEEEERAPFDIHLYGQKVIDTVSKEIRRINPKHFDDILEAPLKEVDFREVSRHKPQFEVCRMFLATLSLSNSGNLLLCNGSQDGSSLQIELLRSEIDRPMDQYLAPSMADGADTVVA